FFQALGFELEFSTDHNSGQLRNGDGPYVFIAEVPEDREPQVQIALKVADADAFRPDPAVEVVTPFEDTHYGTREMTVRDPNGRPSWPVLVSSRTWWPSRPATASPSTSSWGPAWTPSPSAGRRSPPACGYSRSTSPAPKPGSGSA